MTRAKTYTVIVAAALLGIFGYRELTKPRPAGRGVDLMSPTAPVLSVEEKAKRYPRAPEIANPSSFINTDAVTLADLLSKKVILVDFWTYSCINCQRTIPYLNAWWKKYKDQGLVIVGVHTPEFAFEKKSENVAAAVERFGIKYPVVLDNDYATWNAYQNRYWPRKYLVDIDGFIVYDHIGEGAYEETERRIQEALAERSSALGLGGGISGEISRPESEAAGDVAKIRSPEIYFGASRNTTLANGASGAIGEQLLTAPQNREPNRLYLDGRWTFESEFAENRTAPARIAFRYRAKEVYLVAGASQPVVVSILQDGKPLQQEAGKDVQLTNDGAAIAAISGERLYRLVANPDYGEHTLEIIVETPGLRAFTFTFG